MADVALSQDSEQRASDERGRRERELDQELVRRVQAGESAAFDLPVRKYQHPFVGLDGGYIADWGECQDVAPDTSHRAYRDQWKFRDPAGS